MVCPDMGIMQVNTNQSLAKSVQIIAGFAQSAIFDMMRMPAIMPIADIGACEFLKQNADLLKIGKLTHQDIGQMDFYIRYFEEAIKLTGDNPTIGLILCAEKNEAMAKYTLLKGSKNFFASKYKLYLPTEKELKEELKRERQLLELEMRKIN